MSNTLRPPPLRQSHPRAHIGAPSSLSSNQSNIWRFDRAHTHPSKVPAVVLRLFTIEAHAVPDEKTGSSELPKRQCSLLDAFGRELTGLGDDEIPDPDFLDFKEKIITKKAMPVVQRLSSKCLSVYYSSPSDESVTNKSVPNFPRGWFFITQPPKEYKLVINIASLGLLHGRKSPENQHKRDLYSKLKVSLATVAIVKVKGRMLSQTLLDGDGDSSFSWSVGLRWRKGNGGLVDVRFYRALDAPIAVEGITRFRAGYERWVKLGREIENSAVRIGLYSKRGDINDQGGESALERNTKRNRDASADPGESEQLSIENSRSAKKKRGVRFHNDISNSNSAGNRDPSGSPTMGSPINFG